MKYINGVLQLDFDEMAVLGDLAAARMSANVETAFSNALIQNGSRALTADWDIGNGRMIQADKIRARDGDGLALYEDGGNGIFVQDGGNIGKGTTSPGKDLEIRGTPSPAIRLKDSAKGINWDLVAGNDNKFYFTNNAGSPVWYIFENSKVGIQTIAPGSPLAVNKSADGTIVDFESADVVEGSVSIAGNTTSYNTFMGSHYTQLKDGQKTPPVGAIVIATGEIIRCEANIEVPVMERYYENENEVPVKEGIQDDIIEEQIDTGRKQTAYVLINGKVIKTEIPILEIVKTVRGKKLKEGCRLDKENGKVYKKTDKVLKDNEEPPENVAILERQKTKGEVPLTEIKTKAVSGIERKEYFSYTELASQKADKSVYGVYHAKLSDNAKGQSFGEDDKPVHQIAALGLYKVRVTDTNGNIVAGDYIQSSIRAGEGERQEDDVLHNYTVAKSIVDIDWNAVAVDMQLAYKWKLIPATLHAG